MVSFTGRRRTQQVPTALKMENHKLMCVLKEMIKKLEKIEEQVGEMDEKCDFIKENMEISFELESSDEEEGEDSDATSTASAQSAPATFQ